MRDKFGARAGAGKWGSEWAERVWVARKVRRRIMIRARRWDMGFFGVVYPVGGWAFKFGGIFWERGFFGNRNWRD
ncbi:hypothetical protein A3850_011990 [Lewinella sp. 4G2]|nr:hypothetical protein A3850_011990 [Lewinella sp. 4G2]